MGNKICVFGDKYFHQKSDYEVRHDESHTSLHEAFFS